MTTHFKKIGYWQNHNNCAKLQLAADQAKELLHDCEFYLKEAGDDATPEERARLTAIKTATNETLGDCGDKIRELEGLAQEFFKLEASIGAKMNKDEDEKFAPAVIVAESTPITDAQ